LNDQDDVFRDEVPKVTWDAARKSTAASGAYYYQLIAGGTIQAKK